MAKDGDTASQEAAMRQARSGVILAAIAYGLWGVSVLFYKLLEHVPPFELIANRSVWSVVFVGLVLALWGKLADVVALLRTPRVLALLVLSSALIAVNWTLFVWSIGVARVLEVSLGYYINPLMSVLLGVVVLGERLSPLQGLSLLLASLGVGLMVVLVGYLPWVSLVLALTFALYGLIHKWVRVAAPVGLMAEVLVISGPALAYLWFLEDGGVSRWGEGGMILLLLALTGPMTALPLLAFAGAAHRLRLATLGLMQYIAPSLHFLIAAFVFGEPMGAGRWLVFGLIWIALLLFTWDAMAQEKMRRAALIKTP